MSAAAIGPYKKVTYGGSRTSSAKHFCNFTHTAQLLHIAHAHAHAWGTHTHTHMQYHK